MSVVPPLALMPHWFSGGFLEHKVGTSLLSRTLASTLPAMESMVIPQ